MIILSENSSEVSPTGAPVTIQKVKDQIEEILRRVGLSIPVDDLIGRKFRFEWHDGLPHLLIGTISSVHLHALGLCVSVQGFIMDGVNPIQIKALIFDRDGAWRLVTDSPKWILKRSPQGKFELI